MGQFKDIKTLLKTKHPFQVVPDLNTGVGFNLLAQYSRTVNQ